MEHSKVTDNSSHSCRQADMDTIFKATNFELKGSDPNDDNPLEVRRERGRDGRELIYSIYTVCIHEYASNQTCVLMYTPASLLFCFVSFLFHLFTFFFFFFNKNSTLYLHITTLTTMHKVVHSPGVFRGTGSSCQM